MKSPGPLGCFEHRTSQNVHVRSKPGFGQFHDLYDPSTGSFDTETSGFSAQKSAYDTTDRLATMKINNIFMYPANGVKIVGSEIVAGSSKNMTMTVNWSDNTFRIEAALDEPSGRFMANFQSGETLSISKSEKTLDLAFSDSDANHYTFTNQGDVIVESFAKFSGSSQEKEKKRIIMPNGVVIKHFLSGSCQVIFPDGSVANRKNSSTEWIKIDNNSGLKYSIESRPLKNEIEFSREDFVTITSGEIFLKAEHSCGTKIKSEDDKKVLVEAPGLAKVCFKGNGAITIIVNDQFSIERDGSTIHVLKVTII